MKRLDAAGDGTWRWLAQRSRRAGAPRGAEAGDTDRVGRLIAVLLFIAVLVPGVLLARAWWLAADRRVVAGGAVELAEPTREGALTLRRQAQHGRRIRRLGLLLGVAGVIASVVVFADAAGGVWGAGVVVGLLFGVPLAGGAPPRPPGELARPPPP